MSISSAEDAVAALDAVDRVDPERAHSEADAILVEYLRMNAPEVADAWEWCKDECGGFWYA